MLGVPWLGLVSPQAPPPGGCGCGYAGVKAPANLERDSCAQGQLSWAGHSPGWGTLPSDWEGGGEEAVGAHLVQGRDSSHQADSAVGRSCRQGGPWSWCPPVRPHPGKGGGCRPGAASERQLRSLCRSFGAPEPWSPRAACFLPWWSWATSSLWPLCGTGAGGAGGHRMSKVSPWRLPPGPLAPATAPAKGGWRRGGGEGPPPSHPCISLFPPLPVPELSSCTW